MNRITQSDLSHNETKLDYQALVTTANVAVGNGLENIARYQGQLREALLTKDITRIHLSGERLQKESNYLAITSDTLAALLGGLDREELEIVNKPEITKAL